MRNHVLVPAAMALAALILGACAGSSSLPVVETTSRPAVEVPTDTRVAAVATEADSVFINVAPRDQPEVSIQYQIPMGSAATDKTTFHAQVATPPTLPAGLQSEIELVFSSDDGAEQHRLSLVQATDATFAGESFGPLGLPGSDETEVAYAWIPAPTQSTSFAVDRAGSLDAPTVARDFSLTVQATARLVTIEQVFTDIEEGEGTANNSAEGLVGTIAVSAGDGWTDLSVVDNQTTRNWPIDRLVFSARGAGVDGPKLWFAFTATNGLDAKTEIVGPFQT